MGIKQVFGRMIEPILRELTIESAVVVTPRFRWIVLRGDGLKGPRCAPGDKVQVMLDGDFRTYTPFAFDPVAGRMSLLVYSHGDAPGSEWGRRAREGDVVHVFGPRGSLPFDTIRRPVVLAGDETSIAAARALKEKDPSATAILEVTDAGESAEAAAAIGLEGSFVARLTGDAHHAELDASVRAALGPESTLVLTGKAPTIQALRASLRARPLAHAKQQNKAYWAPGKRGLD